MEMTEESEICIDKKKRNRRSVMIYIRCRKTIGEEASTGSLNFSYNENDKSYISSPFRIFFVSQRRGRHTRITGETCHMARINVRDARQLDLVGETLFDLKVPG